ncbi:hypothetical protein B0A55_12593 [Friedmanniomyces simplex]|uniref:F-box domain-containing protein n=1 Tax=Friedmanniomyces simplex TaxID=329884 RepID=A0A4U0W4Z5_9PEZI|nr:hypothetical protein B0A55_12593 [Friedmanniomyces simplex]
MSKILDLPELLGNILLHLPLRDLLFAQKVCAHWKQSIEASPAIQKALFFKPGTAGDVDPKGTAGHRSLPADFAGSKVASNPLLLTDDEPYDPSEHANGVWARVLDAKPEASCRRMYMTQPPAESAALYRVAEFEGDSEENLVFVYAAVSPELSAFVGGTFGALLNRLFEEIEEEGMPEWKGHVWYDGEVALVVEQ